LRRKAVGHLVRDNDGYVLCTSKMSQKGTQLDQLSFSLGHGLPGALVCVVWSGVAFIGAISLI
jgi:hypothetical protein